MPNLMDYIHKDFLFFSGFFKYIFQMFKKKRKEKLHKILFYFQKST